MVSLCLCWKYLKQSGLWETNTKNINREYDVSEIWCGMVILPERSKGKETDGEIKILENGMDNFLKGIRNKPKSTRGNYI